jgi:hypothetical protein
VKKLRGNTLFAAVVTVTSLWFFQIDFNDAHWEVLLTATTAFNNTIDNPGAISLASSFLTVLDDVDRYVGESTSLKKENKRIRQRSRIGNREGVRVTSCSENDCKNDQSSDLVACDS